MHKLAGASAEEVLRQIQADFIHLLFMLDKDEQEDLTAGQRKDLRVMVAELKKV